ncbi:MAG: SusC/RagA family TonB-linked outer membrane protein [Mucilaginibacter polytrichastri]|nr:SusC/RagA family TonB-linked outer membrane protein [Mucilaginibacter polytrichastri]
MMLESSALSLFPAVSLQQFIKGQSPGLYVQEPTGEPGTQQNMFLHGTPLPLLSAKDLYQTQPLVVLDGIPLVAEHPFAYDLQQYDFVRLGPATNTLANIDMDNLESVTVLSDIAETSQYGPLAANGVIVLKSKATMNRRRITFNSYIGMAQRSSVTTLNGAFENNFRSQFYDKYQSGTAKDNYPLYLSDSLNNSYYGSSNWSDLYYRNAMIYSINAGISGGTDRANFRFSLGNLKNEGIADNTGINRYSTMFNINMKPLNWLTFSAYVNGNRLERQRNRNMRDRFAEMKYLPDLGAPLSPLKNNYQSYLNEFGKSIDDNKSNIVDGNVQLAVDIGKFYYVTKFMIDYNEGYRDIFYPSTLLEANNYASNYYGYNQRLLWTNTFGYDYTLQDLHRFHLELGQAWQSDLYRYDYAYAYKGPNDFIKVNLLQSNPALDNYLGAINFNQRLTYKFLDRTAYRLASFTGKGDYEFNKIYRLSLQLRIDGSSNAQPTNRWFYSPVVAGYVDLKEGLLKDNAFVNNLNVHASWGKLGRLQPNDRFGQGPNYTVDVGWAENPLVASYNAFGTLSRPYTQGWVGYDIPWAYNEQINIGVDATVFNNRISAAIQLYKRDDKNQLIGIPAYAEYGYTQDYRAGMNVRNMGVDFRIGAQPLSTTSKLKWQTSLNINYNRNTLTALPGGLNELIVGNRMLKTGSAVDSYWLLQNEGIYTSDAEVPVNPQTGRPMTYQGITLRAGDPKWRDVNGDFTIDDNDRVLKGHFLPVVSGGFDNTFHYGNWMLNANIYYNLGRDLINQEMANRFDFVNNENGENINSVKEITYWEKRGDYSKYPLYNPWSTVLPYQSNQDLFLENASFVKLRAVSLGYDLAKWLKEKKSGISKLYLYATVNNVFTLTKYTGQDPELVNYTGYDTGYGIPLPRTWILGVKMDL